MKNIGMVFQLPKYWQILSDFDKYQYNCLRANLSANYSKNQRNKRIENFTEILEIIRRFCVRGDGDDWRRFLVCGYCCFPDGIAINTRQLKLLIFKCKSSINGSLHKMGLSSNIAKNEATNSLIMAIPILRDNINEMRQWTVRKFIKISDINNEDILAEPQNDYSESGESQKSEGEEDHSQSSNVNNAIPSIQNSDSSSIEEYSAGSPTIFDFYQQEIFSELDFT
ncbi:hypothetical protein TVAG_000300 [Trichomonas vaginalis G3]|uniref:Initiator binding domain-containing protein n=1 Tax=Trichomonas vaginalis (strain ATCC PRA-98 / G3) TaxID=412133 RepID=A2FFZ1_TRIV3|nr:transcription-initiator DNA-binding domain ibd family [Trichomonas vaginalis G3]EAX96201.1 hypothetical protein TVAG_000300 [Trichomonas vaginalis G3]KAI5506289.1 transcription-initiator DNA-binding domain ibd family [Trichomonas vaginalis G3]|eukprot:XP_001309131.1 hypothetical protein [Trichomonas vaginalis G3]